jgi:hypothetical protein
LWLYMVAHWLFPEEKQTSYIIMLVEQLGDSLPGQKVGDRGAISLDAYISQT